MRAKKKKSVADVIEQAMPGWKIVSRPATAAIRARATSGAVKPDAISPGLAAQQTKYFGKITAKMTKKKDGAGKHAQFVTVVPASQPDSAKAFQKVVLVKDGKVIAQQG